MDLLDLSNEKEAKLIAKEFLEASDDILPFIEGPKPQRNSQISINGRTTYFAEQNLKMNEFIMTSPSFLVRRFPMLKEGKNNWKVQQISKTNLLESLARKKTMLPSCNLNA